MDPSPRPPTAAVPDNEPPLAEVGLYRSRRRARDHGLVILSMQIPYWIDESEGRSRIMVEAEHLDAVRDQIAKFDRENRFWPPRPPPLAPPRNVSVGSLILFGLILAAFYLIQTAQPGRLEAIGALAPPSVFTLGQWWRPITALCLHASIAHLAGNVGIGAYFFYFVCRAYGTSPGWFLILICGAAGNACAAFLQRGAAYEAIGASTAVFAALGILTGTAFLQGSRPAPRGLTGRNGLIALAAGLALLGLLGAGEPRTDVVAHGTGFLSGLAAGALLAAFPAKSFRRPRLASSIMALLTTGLLAAAWLAAFAHESASSLS